MNIDSLFPNDKNLLTELTAIPSNAGASDSSYSTEFRKLQQMARSKFPQAADADEALNLYAFQKIQQDEKKIKDLDQIADVNQQRISTLQKSNAALKKELSQTKTGLETEKAELSDVEKLISDVTALKNTSGLSPEKFNELNNTIEALKKGSVSQTALQDLESQINKIKSNPTQASTQDFSDLEKRVKASQEELEKERGESESDIAQRLRDLEIKQSKIERREKDYRNKRDADSRAKGTQGSKKGYQQTKAKVEELEKSLTDLLQKIQNKNNFDERQTQELENLQQRLSQNDAYDIEQNNEIENINSKIVDLGTYRAQKQIPGLTLGTQQPPTAQKHFATEAEEADNEREMSPLELNLRMDIGRQVTNRKHGGLMGTIIDVDNYKYEIEDSLGNRFKVQPKDVSVVFRKTHPGIEVQRQTQQRLHQQALKHKNATVQKDQPEPRIGPTGQYEMFEGKKMKKDITEGLLDLFIKKIDEEGELRDTGRMGNPGYAPYSLKNSELDVDGIPNIDYEGDNVDAPLDAEFSPVVDLKIQMKDPESAGSQGLQNLGQPLDKMKNFDLYPENNLDDNLGDDDVVFENQRSPVVDMKKQQVNPQTPGSRALPRWAMPGDQYMEEDDLSDLPEVDLIHMAANNTAAARELHRRRRIKTNESRIKRDRYITEIYEAI